MIAARRLRLLRDLGAELREMAARGGRDPRGGPRRDSESRLADILDAPAVVARKRAERWQRVAAVSEDVFEDYLATGLARLGATL